MNLVWTAHLANSPQEKHDFEVSLLNSKHVLDRLIDLISEREGTITRIENNPKEYEDAGWAFKQAHLNGRKATYA